ncbi:MAG: TonB-dependent receptor [Candidatus Neomarinimicrobiota bacterium]
MNNPKRFLFNPKGILIFVLFFSVAIAQDLSTLSGRVLDSTTERPLQGASVVSGDAGTSTDRYGLFTLAIPQGSSITVSMIGYESATLASDQKFVTVRLAPTVLKGEEVIVLANRALPGVTPVAFSTLTPSEIEQHYFVEDIPMVLASEPGVYAYSESGNGTGYSYVSIRGFDQSRISVMLDNVPLNDNESHQVYWVDHGDILSNAKDVQIQRGIGNSLYGSAAFGGSINLITDIGGDEQELSASVLTGSYNTSKYRLKFNSGKSPGESLSLSIRASQIHSDGYREFHESLQRGIFLGLEHRSSKMTHQLRASIGYENTDLLWDGVAASDINDRKKRREGYKSYTDDFLQQVYSLNSIYRISGESYVHNVAYFVSGSGYYEVFKTGSDFYSYNLDVDDAYPDCVEQDELFTDLLRRKWIVNHYYGIVPRWTWKRGGIRFDLGGEIRFYRGDHFGEAASFSDSTLEAKFGDEWYKYYEYFGTKRSISTFAHLVYSFGNGLRVIGDIQYQTHRWKLDQEKIGHAAGHQISAPWDFLNPRFGFVYGLTESLSLFGNYGKAQKEPTDDQIINADDVWSEPVMAAAEVVNNFELGTHYRSNRLAGNLNLYRIVYNNEQLKNIDVEQEGEYDYYSTDSTVHQGIEAEISYQFSPFLRLSANATVSQNTFVGPEREGNLLPNVPIRLLNAAIQFRPTDHATLYIDLRHVGKQYVDDVNTEEGAIDPFTVVNLAVNYQLGPAVFGLKVNNLFDTLYSTYGYGYEWDGFWAFYWPGATRNYYATITLQF